MAELTGKKVAMLIAKDFEDSEALDPKAYLEARGADVTVIGVARETYAGKKGGSLAADTTFAEVESGSVRRARHPRRRRAGKPSHR